MSDTLAENIRRMEKELAEMKETLERRKRNWPDVLVKGMVFRDNDGDIFMTRAKGLIPRLDLVQLSGVPGNFWSQGNCFNGDEQKFTYIGLARDVLSIKA